MVQLSSLNNTVVRNRVEIRRDVGSDSVTSMKRNRAILISPLIPTTIELQLVTAVPPNLRNKKVGQLISMGVFPKGLWTVQGEN